MAGAPHKASTILRNFYAAYMVDPNSGCWLWTRSVDDWGYGFVRLLGKKLPAHRLSWNLHNGDIPTGFLVLHKCDTPACVRPDHLFIGTNRDNVNDKVAKSRQQKGERVAVSKLTEADVRVIKTDYRTNADLARVLGVSPRCVKDVRSGRTWGHVTP